MRLEREQKSLILLGVTSLFIGFLVFAVSHDWIVISFPGNTRHHATHLLHAATVEKKVALSFWHNGSWKKEITPLVWPSDRAEQLYNLINSWLTFLHDEKLMKKKIAVQSVALSKGYQEAIISFDASPLSTEEATYTKWLWLESLLKVIRDNVDIIQKIRLLVNHTPCEDTQLDLNNAWPVQGFFKT